MKIEKRRKLAKEFKKEFLKIPKNRRAETVEMKMILIAKMKKAGFTFSEMGRIMEYSDHTTAISLHKKYLNSK